MPRIRTPVHPSPGRITSIRPASGPWVRDDTGVYRGVIIPRFYDTLMAKLIVWGTDREAAIARMARSLHEYKVVGVQTTIPILQRIMRHEDFVAGRLSTQLLERLMGMDRPEAGGRRRSIALIAAALAAYDRAGTSAPLAAPVAPSAWRQALRPGGRVR
jgi:acetyl-CoA carboxylase biotin carboxylase subunit